MFFLIHNFSSRLFLMILASLKQVSVIRIVVFHNAQQR